MNPIIMNPELQKIPFSARSPEMNLVDDYLPEHIGKKCYSTPIRGDESHVGPLFDVSSIYPNSSMAGSETVARRRLSRRDEWKGLIQHARNRSEIFFGFVTVGKTVRCQHKFTNVSDELLRFKCSLEFNSGVIKVENSELMVRPKEEAVITLSFTPDNLSFFVNKLRLVKHNGALMNFSYKIFGYGGNANVVIGEEHFKDGTMHISSSGAFVYFPDFFPPFPSHVNPTCTLTLVNKGNRRAFVRIIALSMKDKELPENYVRIAPSRCVIEGDGKSKKFKIRVTNCFNFGKRNTLGSSFTEVLSTRDDCSLKLKVLWGEEKQRSRFRIWQSKMDEKFLIQGEDFCQSYGQHEDTAKDLDRLANQHPLQFENVEFKNSIRMFQINVIDNRLCSILDLD